MLNLRPLYLTMQILEQKNLRKYNSITSWFHLHLKGDQVTENSNHKCNTLVD
jgi:hypothetical protein